LYFVVDCGGDMFCASQVVFVYYLYKENSYVFYKGGGNGIKNVWFRMRMAWGSRSAIRGLGIQSVTLYGYRT